MNEDNIRKYLTDLGLKSEEIDKLKIEDAIQYLKFYHLKQRGVSTILFIAFSESEANELSVKAENGKLVVKNRLSKGLSFICISENADAKRIEKAKNFTKIILTKMTSK